MTVRNGNEPTPVGRCRLCACEWRVVPDVDRFGVRVGFKVRCANGHTPRESLAARGIEAGEQGWCRVWAA